MFHCCLAEHELKAQDLVQYRHSNMFVSKAKTEKPRGGTQSLFATRTVRTYVSSLPKLEFATQFVQKDGASSSSSFISS